MMATLGPFLLGSAETGWHGIAHGDARALCDWLPAESVDVIYTDPPYLREFVPLYGWLAEMAARVLKPGGFVLAMAGGSYKDRIMSDMRKHLTYHWDYHFQLTGSLTGKVHPHGAHKPIIVRTKSILAFSKGKSAARTVTYSLMSGTGGDKEYHRWGQDVVSARYYIDCFSRPGDVVLDPFGGGGTTAEAARLIGRRWLLMDSDPVAVATARARLLRSDMPLFASLPLTERMAL